MLLDVGSGSHPHPDIDVGCDLYFSAHLEGGEVTLTENFVICDAHYLPFKTKSFSIVNCSHVIDHLENTRLGFKELKRVSLGGRITTPGPLYEEVLFGFPFHKWTFIKRGRKIYFRKPNRLKINGFMILPLGWITHRFTLHKKFSHLVMPIRHIPLFNMEYRW